MRTSKSNTTEPPKEDYDRALKAAVEAVAYPDEEQFLRDYQVDDNLRHLAAVLIQHCEEFRFIEELGYTISFLWKRTGGKSNGKMVLGKCIKTSGLVLFFGQTDFVIWLAADHLTYLYARKRTVNIAALMYHELSHITRDDHDQPANQGHEFEGFSGEIERFGIWRDDMKPIATAFQDALPYNDSAPAN